MNKERHINLSIRATGYSFIIGSMLLIGFLVTHSQVFVSFGLLYIGLAFLINGGIFITLFISFINTNREHGKFFLYSLLPFINLPIAFTYCAIALNQF